MYLLFILIEDWGRGGGEKCGEIICCKYFLIKIIISIINVFILKMDE